eukprot:CAMPEP_0118929388 /NCGR_PEP_ID=MMETSP1169-20130426/6408_1 /TAXON_ID=36882 /ORGANISM="Pyramimonas obovata, Strain CCMP722" /LENGTH=75 /DNA_ID=CAMNT_0006871571 /DNA_START=717 /DNA_END=940 /DNA_ORIENTATION=+
MVNDVSTLAGYGGSEDEEGERSGHKDGEGVSARFQTPSGVAVDRDDNIIVADLRNRCIRKVTPQGVVSTLAGTGG